MDNKELEVLARQLWTIHNETWPEITLDWEDLRNYEREAWIRVAQFVATQSEDDIDRIMYSGYSPDHR